VASLGAILVPLHTRYLAKETAHVLRGSDATTLVLTDHFLNSDAITMLIAICPEFPSSRPGKLHSQTFPALRNVVVDGSPHTAAFAFSELAQMSPEGGVSVVVNPDDLALIKYTSGSTAAPKGVMLSHGPIIRNAFHMGERMQVVPADRVFSGMPFYHAGGSILTILMTMSQGASMVLVDHFDAGLALAAIERERCTIHLGMDIMYLREIDHPSFDWSKLRSLRGGWIAGSPESARKIHESMPFPFVNIYGMTELSGNACMTSPEDFDERRLEWAGESQPGMEVGIFDVDSGTRLGVRATGEIRVRGWGVMKGYFGEAVSTSASIDDDGWLHTGDLGILDEHSYLKYLGRLKEMLKVGGDNVSPEEVEGCLSMHPAVSIVQVVGVADPVYGEVPFAFVQLVDGQRCDPAELIAHCRKNLARFKVPHHIRLMAADDWQLSGPEKVQKHKLRDLAARELAGERR
jgi:fatty-acyl-CoA synthase